MRRTAVGLASLLLVPALALLTACATSSTGGTIPEPAPDTPDTAQVEATETDQAVRYAASTIIIQTGTHADPELCLSGTMLASNPPQCGGPVVIGLDWADVPNAETVSDVTWGGGWVVGTFDGETFTLTEPVRQDPPDGVQEPASFWQGEDHPALCADPWRGGDESALVYDEVPQDWPEGELTDRILGPESQGLVAELDARARALPGYVKHYVSNGFDEFNVLLTRGSDVEAAHTALREVWPGWLCVGALDHDTPSQAEAEAASRALATLAEDLDGHHVLGWEPTLSEGTFSVWLVLGDDETRTMVEEALAPWYAPEKVHVTTKLVPVPSAA